MVCGWAVSSFLVVFMSNLGLESSWMLLALTTRLGTIMTCTFGIPSGSDHFAIATSFRIFKHPITGLRTLFVLYLKAGGDVLTSTGW